MCVHVRMCLRVSLAATCTCMLDSTYEGGACAIMCVCVCVCVCVAVAMTVVILSHINGKN